VLFTVLNSFVFRVDAVPAVNEMYWVVTQLENGDQWQFRRPQFEALRKETRVFTDVYAAVGNIDVGVNGRTMDGTLVTGNFFQVFGIAPVMGRALAPADGDARNPVIVLSDKGWRRHFDRDPRPTATRLVQHGGFERVALCGAFFGSSAMTRREATRIRPNNHRLRRRDFALPKTLNLLVLGSIPSGLTNIPQLLMQMVLQPSAHASAAEDPPATRCEAWRPTSDVGTPRAGTTWLPSNPRPSGPAPVETPLCCA